MGEKSDEIKGHIDATRGELDRNLRELSDRVKPRNVYRQHPKAILGAAVGGGVLAAWAISSAILKFKRA